MVFDALFQLDGGLAYAREDTPEQLKDAFTALLECLAEVAGDGVHPGLFTEVFWAALHGLATLTRAGRLLPEDAESRVELLVDRLAVIRHAAPPRRRRGAHGSQPDARSSFCSGFGSSPRRRPW
ncbi:transcriptional regulator [Streptomyces venezuelae]|nr:transcriptional regulator [Streptomyces venezuelae]CUM35731.1 Transcriptional regulator, TetR family [Streptomyces venezuelae]